MTRNIAPVALLQIAANLRPEPVRDLGSTGTSVSPGVAGMVMLGLNGHRTTLTEDDADKLMITIATATSDLAWISETLAIVAT